MKNTQLSISVFSGFKATVLMLALSALLMMPFSTHADVSQKDINAQKGIVEDNLVVTMTEYVKLLQLMLIDILEDRVHELKERHA